MANSQEPSPKSKILYGNRRTGTEKPKENLLIKIAAIENEIKKLGGDHDALRQRLEDLRTQVESILQEHGEERQNLQGEIQRLNKEVESDNISTI
jgi:predicted  nucleic acid-binding Zn-ribbon protein